MHPYIKKLEAKKLSLFKTLEVNFKPDINILIGPNAAGKTSVLRIITYCFNASALNKVIHSKDTSFRLIINEGNKNDFSSGYQSLDTDNKVYQKGSSLLMGKLYPNPSFYPSPGKVPYNLLAIGANRYFDYKEITGTKKEPMAQEAKRDYDKFNTDYIDKPSLPSIKQWMINRYFIQNMEWAKIENKNWKYIITKLGVLAPDENEFSFLEIQRDHEPKFKIDGNVCYLEELSSGFKSVLAIVFSIVQWIEEVNEGEKRLVQNAEGTVLIDEIDVHLHPSWQSKILHSLKELFPKLQFIVTTHSPLVMSTLKNSDKDSIQAIIHDKEGNYRCSEIDTYGNDASSIIETVMHSLSRDKKTNEKFQYLFNLIETEQYDKAKSEILKIKNEYGDIPEMIRAESMLDFLAE